MAQDPKIKKLNNGKWRMRWNNGSKSFTADSRDEVVAFKAKLMANGMVDPRTITVPSPQDVKTFEHVALAYIEARRARISPGSLARYLGELHNHVFPVIGGMEINDIRAEDIRKVICAAGETLAPSSLRKLHGGVLYPVFKWAIGNEWRDRANPCEITAQELSQDANTQPVLLPEQAPMLLDCAYAIAQGEEPADRNGLAGDFFTLLYGTGLRWQEAAALDVGAVDWKRRVLVVRQVLRDRVGIATNKGKSKAAFRDVPLPAADDDPLVVMLAARTHGRPDNAPLFVTRRGTRIYEALAYDLLQAALEFAEAEHGFAEQLAFHAFRRGFATALEDREIPANSLKLVLGHVRHSGATAAYVRLTAKQVENIRPYMGGLCWRASQLAERGGEAEAEQAA